MQLTGWVRPLDGLLGDGHRPASTGTDEVVCTAYGAPREGEIQTCMQATSVDRVRVRVL